MARHGSGFAGGGLSKALASKTNLPATSFLDSACGRLLSADHLPILRDTTSLRNRKGVAGVVTTWLRSLTTLFRMENFDEVSNLQRRFGEVPTV
jgi:hypothetical protein